MSDDSHEYDEEVFATIGEIHESMVLDDPLYKKGYQAGAASRDAEIAGLVEALEHSVLYVPDLAAVPGIAAVLAKVRMKREQDHR